MKNRWIKAFRITLADVERLLKKYLIYGLYFIGFSVIFNASVHAELTSYHSNENFESWTNHWSCAFEYDDETKAIHRENMKLLNTILPSHDPIWTSFGQAPNGPIFTVATDSRDIIYIGGKFTKIGDDHFYHAAAWNGKNWVRVGDPRGIQIPGFDDVVRKIIVDKDDHLYFAGDFKKFKDQNGDENKISSPNIYSTNDKDLGGGVVSEGYLRGMALDNNGDLVIAGVEFHWDPFHHSKYYYRKYKNGSWSGINYIKDIRTTQEDNAISIVFDNGNNVVLSIPKKGVFKFEGSSRIDICRTSNNDIVSNVLYNPTDKNIYFCRSSKKIFEEQDIAKFMQTQPKRVLNPSTGITGSIQKMIDAKVGSALLRYDGQNTIVVHAIDRFFINNIALDISRNEVYYTSYDPKFNLTVAARQYSPCIFKTAYVDKKLIFTRLNGNEENNWRLFGFGTPANELFKDLQLKKDGNLLVAGDFSHIMLSFPSNKIAQLLTDDLSNIYFASNVHVGEKNNPMVIGTNLTSEGRVAIVEPGQVSNITIRSDLRKSNSLFVDLGIASKDLIIVDPDAWADQVLDKEYPLWPLARIKTFIANYGHLPNVPSEEEIIKQGYAIHTMNTMFMTKIEEQVLHSIRLNEEIEQSIQRKKAMLEEIKKLSGEINTRIQP